MTNKTEHRQAGVVLLTLLTILAALVIARADPGAQHPTVSTALWSTPVATTAPPLETAPLPALEITPPTETAQAQEPVGRYQGIELTEDETDMLAALVYCEAGNQSAEGQQAVVEVVLNRLMADNFPDMLHEVIFQGYGTRQQQFTPAGQIATTTPTQEQYDAIEAALHGEEILPEDVVYFSTKGENSRVWGKIGDHVFCRQYDWGAGQ